MKYVSEEHLRNNKGSFVIKLGPFLIIIYKGRKKKNRRIEDDTSD